MAIFDGWFGSRNVSDKQGATRLSADLFDEEFLRQLKSLSLMSKRSTAGQRRGERRSKKRGGGVEFADHRSYVPGDDIRFLDIGVYQRFGKLLLRLFEEEEDLSLYFLVDDSASMVSPDAAKLNQAAKVTAALCYIGLSGLDRVSVCSMSERVDSRLPPLRGKQRVFRVLRYLSEIKARGKTDLGAAMRTFVAQNKRRGLVVLLSDLFDPHGFEAGINVLRFNKFEPVVLHLIDQRDTPSALSGDLLIEDAETDKTREVTMTRSLSKRLEQAIADRNEAIERFCGSKAVPYFPVDVTRPFDQVVLDVLRSGGLVK